MQDQKYFFRFYIKIASREYILSTLKVDLKNNQIFYVFNHPNDGATEIIIADHISCHSGQTHLKTNEDKILALTRDLFLPLDGESKIILLKSFFLSDNGLHLLKENINFQHKWRDPNPEFNQEILIGDLTEPIDFSLMLVLVPGDSSNDLGFIETSAITDKNGKEIKLSSLRRPDLNIGLIKAFPKHNILVFPTSYIHDNSRWDKGPFWKIFHPMFSEYKI